MATAIKQKPKITLIARADNTGLGNQTWEFYKHMKPHKTYIIDLTNINKSLGKTTELHLDRYPDGQVIEGFPDGKMINEMLNDTDILYSIEIPYNYQVFALAKLKGVKTVLQYNYEFLDYLQTPDLPTPDLLLAPSMWHYANVNNWVQYHNLYFGSNTQLKYLPVPTNHQVMQPKIRSQANHFLHIAGHPTFMDRNGTLAVLEAMGQVQARDITLTIYSQYPIDTLEDRRIVVKHIDVNNYWEIYKPEYDVLLLPRRYGGLSLQLNEALANAMPVIMTDVSPQHNMLPSVSLIKTEAVDIIQTRAQINCYKPDISDLAQKIDDLHCQPALCEYLSEEAINYSQDKSWAALKPKYEEVLASLCQVVM